MQKKLLYKGQADTSLRKLAKLSILGCTDADPVNKKKSLTIQVMGFLSEGEKI